MSAKQLLLRVMPRRVMSIYEVMRGTRPLHRRTCPICGYQGWFTYYGVRLRVDAKCPGCGSLERHRLFWLWYQQNEIRSPILHFAPEPTLRERLRARHERYQTADLFTKDVDLPLDIEHISLPSGSIQTILCNHVLEHVDDNKALAELFRVLAPGGLLICSVPLVEGWEKTYEVAGSSDPMFRLKHYGQDDHVRFYGRDFRDRVRAAGFELSEFTAEGPEVVVYGLTRGEKVFLGRKPMTR